MVFIDSAGSGEFWLNTSPRWPRVIACKRASSTPVATFSEPACSGVSRIIQLLAYLRCGSVGSPTWRSTSFHWECSRLQSTSSQESIDSPATGAARKGRVRGMFGAPWTQRQARQTAMNLMYY